MKGKVIAVLALICHLLLINCGRIKIDKSTGQFVDESGRSIVFHGVNVVVKLPPYLPTMDKFHPFDSVAEEDIQIMKKYGFNMVRLGVIWESVERSEGVYDMAHLEKVESLINLLGSNGIYVLLDAHQDMFSRLFCGEGVPHFYAKKLSYEKECKTNFISRTMRLLGVCIPLKTFNWRYDEDELPLIDDCRTGFLKFHQSPELATVYAAFYRNENGVQDKFIAFWSVMAEKFKDNPYIIGYDLWNEPWPGNLWSDVRSMWPGYSTQYQVLPFYRKLDKEIRKIQPDYISFFESVPFPDTLPFFGGKVVGGFKETPAGEEFTDRQVLNAHSYCCQAAEDICARGEPGQVEAKTVCPIFHQHKIQVHKQQAKQLGVPLIITEFGACSNSEACYDEMKGFVEAAENEHVSWAYWMYKPFGDHTTTAAQHTEGIFLDNGLPQELKLKALTRPYFQAFQGTPLNSKFEVDSSIFNARFLYDKRVLSPNIVYFNQEIFYPNGFEMNVTDDQGRDIEYVVGHTNEANYFIFEINDKKINSDTEFINVKLICK